MIKQYRLTALLLILLLPGCEKSDEIETIISIDTPDWTESTHGKSAEPDYTTVFPQDKVQRLDMTISNDDWDAIQSDLANMPRTRPGETIDGTFDPIWVSCDLFYNEKQWYKVKIR